MNEPTLFELAQGNATAIGQLNQIMSKMEDVTNMLARSLEMNAIYHEKITALLRHIKPNDN